MSLEKWAEYGWLRAEATSRDEIKSLLTIVDRDLKDANIAAISEDRRFEAAFNAARTAANIALRASGYRTSIQAGHHVKTIESLELTIKADARLIQRMRTLSKKRNATSYDSAGNVSARVSVASALSIPRSELEQLMFGLAMASIDGGGKGSPNLATRRLQLVAKN